jgi:hypothetical protein
MNVSRMATKAQTTLLGAAAAVGLLWVTIVQGVDLIDFDFWLIHQHHIDDILLATGIFLAGLSTDLMLGRRRRREELAALKLQTLQATMRTVHGIVNNFLNNLLLFEMEARGKVSPKYLDDLDELIQVTHQKLKALGDVTTVEERHTPTGLEVSYGRADGSGPRGAPFATRDSNFWSLPVERSGLTRSGTVRRGTLL